MKKIHPDFPVYLIENFNSVSSEELERIAQVIIENKKKHRIPGAGSFWLIDDDEQKTFGTLYNKFESTLKEKIKFEKTPDSINFCNVYYSTMKDFSDSKDPHGNPWYHNHKHTRGSLHNHTTLAAVYYMNVPDNESGTIEFKIDYVHQPDGSLYEISKDARYHQLQERPYEPIDGVRVTTSKEISYQPKNGDLVLFPAYLDHRPRRIMKPGHRIAINVEFQTVETSEEIVKRLEEYLQNELGSEDK
jgi:hypothetical protein